MMRVKARILLSVGIVLALVLGSLWAASAKVEIVYLDQSDAARMPGFQAVVKDFMVANPDIKVVFIGTTENVVLPQQRMIAAGNPPDVVFTHQGAFPAFAPRGGYLNLDSLIGRDKFPLDKYDEQLIGSFSFGGHVYAIPRGRHTNVLYYNRRLFDEAGVNYPSHKWDDPSWTWDKLIEVGKKLTVDKDGDGESDQFGLSSPQAGYAGWYQLVVSFGGEWFDEGYTKTLIGENSAAADAFQMLSDMMWKYNIAAQPEQSAGIQVEGGAWVGGLIGMHAGGTWEAMWYAQMMEERDLNWDYLPIPKQVKAAVNYFPDGIAISKATKHPEEAWALVKFLSQGEPLKQLVAAAKGMPPRADMHEWWRSLYEGTYKYPVDLDVVWNAFNYAIALPVTPAWEEIQSIVNSENDRLFLAEKKERRTGAQVVATIVPKINKALLEAKE